MTDEAGGFYETFLPFLLRFISTSDVICKPGKEVKSTSALYEHSVSVPRQILPFWRQK